MLNVFGNVRQIDNCKADLVLAVGKLYKDLSADEIIIEEVNEDISELIVLSYALGKKLGLDQDEISNKVIKKLRLRKV